jgi:hypothetical protein
MKMLYDIPGFPNYQITKDGGVWSKTQKKFMTPQIDRHGYTTLLLRKDNKRHRFGIHHLLAMTFIPNPDGKKTVDHINRDIADNRLENLRWATYKEQNYNKTVVTFALNSRPVECRSKHQHDIIIGTFGSCSEAACVMFGDVRKNSLINRCARGKKSSAYGYWWRFCERTGE